jgi:hypothetical protein
MLWELRSPRAEPIFWGISWAKTSGAEKEVLYGQVAVLTSTLHKDKRATTQPYPYLQHDNGISPKNTSLDTTINALLSAPKTNFKYRTSRPATQHSPKTVHQTRETSEGKNNKSSASLFFTHRPTDRLSAPPGVWSIFSERSKSQALIFHLPRKKKPINQSINPSIRAMEWEGNSVKITANQIINRSNTNWRIPYENNR